jgi:hypothetical protein
MRTLLMGYSCSGRDRSMRPVICENVTGDW